jgi:hypothetical protein
VGVADAVAVLDGVNNATVLSGDGAFLATGPAVGVHAERTRCAEALGTSNAEEGSTGLSETIVRQ